MKWWCWKADSLRKKMLSFNFSNKKISSGNKAFNKACYSYLGLTCSLNVLWICFLVGALAFRINEDWTRMRKHFIKFNTVSLNTKPVVLHFLSLKQCIISAVITEAVGTSGDQSKLQTSLPSWTYVILHVMLHTIHILT